MVARVDDPSLRPVVKRVFCPSTTRSCPALTSISSTNGSDGFRTNPSFTSARLIDRYENVSQSSFAISAEIRVRMLAVRL